VIRRLSSPRFVGRVSELEALEELLRRTAAGSGGAMLVAGEAGMGKSRLVAEFGTRARGAGALVLVGECVELAEGELAFLPIISALRGVMADEAALEGLGGPLRSALAALWPVRDAPEGVAGGREQLLEGVYRRSRKSAVEHQRRCGPCFVSDGGPRRHHGLWEALSGQSRPGWADRRTCLESWRGRAARGRPSPTPDYAPDSD
jgi:hypothetical protein